MTSYHDIEEAEEFLLKTREAYLLERGWQKRNFYENGDYYICPGTEPRHEKDIMYTLMYAVLVQRAQDRQWRP